MQVSNIRVGERVEYIPDADKPNSRPKGIEFDRGYFVKTKYWEGVIGTVLMITIEGAFGDTVHLAEKNWVRFHVS